MLKIATVWIIGASNVDLWCQT